MSILSAAGALPLQMLSVVHMSSLATSSQVLQSLIVLQECMPQLLRDVVPLITSITPLQCVRPTVHAQSVNCESVSCELRPHQADDQVAMFNS